MNPNPSPTVSNVGAILSRALRLYGHATAVRTDSVERSFIELETRSNRLANALLGLGLQRGDRVAVYLPNCIEIVELEIACYKTGLVKTPINSRLAPPEVAKVIANSEASAIITTAAAAERYTPLLAAMATPVPVPTLVAIDRGADDPSGYESLLGRASDAFMPVAVRASDLAVLHYTSGSTGDLKAAMQTFGNRLAQLRKFLMRPDGVAPGDSFGLVGPITHASGMQIVPALCQGTTLRLFSSFKPDAWLQTMKQERVTHTFLVPTMINMLLAEVGPRYLPLPDLRRMGYGAAPMAPARVLQAMDVFGPVLSQGYGAGETTSGVCTLSVQDHLHARAARPERLASCGRPMLECQVDVLDAQGLPVAPGELGEIVVSGDDVFAGYWRAPELTAEVLENGRYHTGDVARRDEDGYLYIVDRKKDMVISGGFNVYPTEVEAVLYRHPAVSEACVFSVPDDKWGEVVGAHVVLKPGSDAAEEAIHAFCAEQLGGFKRPRLIRFVDELPKNANGKVARKTVREPYWADQERQVN